MCLEAPRLFIQEFKLVLSTWNKRMGGLETAIIRVSAWGGWRRPSYG